MEIRVRENGTVEYNGKDRISQMTKEELAFMIENFIFMYDNSVQDINVFESKYLNGTASDLEFTLHNGKTISINIEIE